MWCIYYTHRGPHFTLSSKRLLKQASLHQKKSDICVFNSRRMSKDGLLFVCLSVRFYWPASFSTQKWRKYYYQYKNSNWPTRSLWGPTAFEFQLKEYDDGQVAKPSWCLVTWTTYLQGQHPKFTLQTHKIKKSSLSLILKEGLFGKGFSIIVIIIIKRISRAPIYHTRWQHRTLYNNTNHTHTHTHRALNKGIYMYENYTWKVLPSYSLNSPRS